MADSAVSPKLTEAQVFAALREVVGSTAWKQVIRPWLQALRAKAFQQLYTQQYDLEKVTDDKLRGFISATEEFLKFEDHAEALGKKLASVLGEEDTETTANAIAQILRGQ